MPSKSPKKSRKRKHEEIQQDSENEALTSTAQKTKRRKISSKSPAKKKNTNKNRNKKSKKSNSENLSGSQSENQSQSTPRRSSRLSQKQNQNNKKKKSSKREEDASDSDSNSPSNSSDESSEFDPNQPSTNKKSKPLQRRRITSNKNNKNPTPSQRISLSQSQTRRTVGTPSQSQRAEEDEEDFELVQHNERVMEMYKWLTSPQSWSSIKNTLQEWQKKESESQDTDDDEDNYADLTVDIINLILYCGGVRVVKLQDIEDCDVDSLCPSDKERFVNKLQKALLVDHEEIESLPSDDDSDGAEEQNENENKNGHHSEDEKAEEAENKKAKKKKKKKKKRDKARTTAERVLHYDQMLWMNGTVKTQKTFESRYRQLMEKIGQVFEIAIFNNDDSIITTILQWCRFLSRSFSYTQLRRLGTFTAFALCDPFIRCIAKNRKPMEKLRDSLDREVIIQKNKNKSCKRGSPRKLKKRPTDTAKMKHLRENIEEYKTKIADLELHRDDMFEKIAAYKASDCNETIRCMVLRHIVKWINIDPSTDSLLRDKYWQYLFYGLQDKSHKVRITALCQLMELFDYQHKFHGKARYTRKPKKNKKRENIIEESSANQLDETRRSVLEPFWDDIRETVNGLLKDKNAAVVKHCIEFINILLRGDMLGANDGDCILNYIFDESDEIRQVSASFIFHDTFDDQAVLKAHESQSMALEEDGNREEEKREDTENTRLRIKDVQKMKDDIVEIIQLMKDRVVDLNLRVNALLNAEKQRINEEDEAEDGDDKTKVVLKENALYRNYVQVSDYIVQSMSKQLPVLREWRILFEILRDADIAEERQKERNITNKNKNMNEDGDGIQDMNIKHYIDDEGQTILCYLILSCVKSVRNKLDVECRNVKAKRGRKSTRHDLDEKQAALDTLKQCILPHLSSLLDMYQADVFKLYPLIKIIPLIPIDAFNSVKSKTHLNQILNSLKIIFSRHDTPFVENKFYGDADASDSEGFEEKKEFVITEDMDDDEREEMGAKIRNKGLKQLKKCIRESIDNELINEIGKSFAFLCDEEYQYKEHCGRFIFDIVTELTDQFDDIYNIIDKKCEKGYDLSTLDALMEDDGDNVSKLNLIQSLYSNLHKQYALKSEMDVGTIQFTDGMEALLRNVYDKVMFDGNKCQISGMLQNILLVEIAHNVTSKLNVLSPDMEKLHELTQQKQCLVKLLAYYVDKIYENEIENDENENKLSRRDLLCILDRIISMMDTLCFFRKITNQHPLLDNTFNNASLIEMEPVYGVDDDHNNNGDGNGESALKQRLLSICEYVFGLPIIEDPYDPSSHIFTENIQIRYFIGCARLSLMNPGYYKYFGAKIISFYHRPNQKKKKKKNQCLTRRDEIIKKITHKLYHNNHAKFEEMLFEAMVMIMNEEKIIPLLRIDTIEKIAKSVSMLEGFTKKNRKYWLVFGRLFLNYILGEIDNIPKYFSYLHALTPFFRTFTNRDKLEIWAYFRNLSRKLPAELHENKAKWQLYKLFRTRLKTEAQKAQRNRSLNLDDDGLENFDLENNNQSQLQLQPQPQSQSHSDINMGVEVASIVDDDDGEAMEREEHTDENEKEHTETERVSVSKALVRETRVAVSLPRGDAKEEEVENAVSHRVSVSKPAKASDDEEEEDEDSDMKDVDNESEEEEEGENTEKSQVSTQSSGRRGGLKRKRNTSQRTTKRRTPSGTWLKRKRNTNK